MMNIINIESSDEEEERRVKVYQREELMSIGHRYTTTEMPSWTCEVLTKHPDCGHIIFPFITEALEEAPDTTLSWDSEILEDMKQSLNSLEEDLVRLSEKLEISEERAALLTQLAQQVETNLHSEFPDCKVVPYGSFSSGFAFENCDLDVYTNLGHSVLDESSAKPSSQWNDREKTRVVAEILRRNERFRSATAVTNAKVPIVKIKDRRTGIRCDVNSSSAMGVKNSQFLNFCKNYDRRVEQLVKIVKYFAYKHGIIGSGIGPHFNSYTVVVLVIFFLQSKHVLPTVASLQEDIPEDFCENWNFAFNKDRKTSLENDQPISELLLEFFRFYASFPFSTDVVSPNVGTAVNKQMIEAGEGPWDNKIESLSRKLNIYKEVVIQDPFELSKNLSKNVSSSRLAHLISSCQYGVNIIEAVIDGTEEFYKLFQDAHTTGIKLEENM